MSDATDNPIVAALPGQDWIAVTRMLEGRTVHDPIVAWLVRADGTLEPVTLSPDGLPGDPRDDRGFRRMHHPSWPDDWLLDTD